MTIAATRNIAINPESVQVPGLLSRILKIVRSWSKSPVGETVPQVQGFQEILPYGFVSRNYISYMSRAVPAEQVSELGDGTRVCQFKNGGVLLDAMSGHMVELDKQGRVILIRVRRSEVDTDTVDCCPSERSSLLGLSPDCKSTMDLPGGISVVSVKEEVRITLPNGTTYAQPVSL